MAVLYDVSDATSQALKTGKVLGLAPAEKQVAAQLVAESLLGLNLPVFTDAAVVERIKLAIVLQMNFQVEQGLDALVEELSTSAHTKEMVKYRDRWVNPQAQAILASLGVLLTTVNAAAWDDFTSHRTRD